jgi:peptidylprolyl isomerase
MASGITAETCKYCFIDLDFDDHRAKLAAAAAFVNATDSRYGFSSSDLRLLGGSELSRVKDLITTDHEWSYKAASTGVETRPPTGGNRIVVELYWDIAPLACENFATLCANGSIVPGSKDKKPKPVPIGSSGKPLTYRGSTMHRCVPGFILQGGDFVLGNGSGGESIYNGKKFKDEKGGLNLKHDRNYVLSMGNSGKNSNSSQFFFTFNAAPQCDKLHVVFGKAISGFEVLDKAESYGTRGGEPTATIRITDCGVLSPFKTPAAGYWYDSPDPDSFSGVSPIFMVFPRVAVLAPTQAVLDKFKKAIGDAAVVTCMASESNADDDSQGAALLQMLETFSVDVAIVAPACKAVIRKIKLPELWNCANVSPDEVLMEAKPVEALACVRTKSWLSRRGWRLEGTTS